MENYSKEIKLSDDAYHFRYYEKNVHRFWYTEWWYFNFIDPDSGMSGETTIALFNPSNHYMPGIGSVNFAAFGKDLKEGIIDIDYIPLTEFSASYENANVRMGNNLIEVISEKEYRICTKSNNGNFAIDLIYESKSPPAFLAKDIQGDNPNWEISSWLSYMPAASVKGYFEFNGKKYNLTNAIGYHDHDWGIWPFYSRTWSWAYLYLSNEQVVFDLGIHAAFEVSVCYFTYKNQQIEFDQKDLIFNESDFKEWNLLWKYPQKLKLDAVDKTGKYRLSLEWDVLQTAALWKYPLIVFEQSAFFQGSLLEYKDNQWKTILEIFSEGFCEATGKYI